MNDLLRKQLSNRKSKVLHEEQMTARNESGFN